MEVDRFIAEQVAEFAKDDRATSRRLLRQLIAERLGLPESHLLSHPERELPAELVRDLREEVQRLQAGQPWAYSFGHVPFLEDSFRIDRRALVPRPETEELTRLFIEHHRTKPPTTILDMCCGSGVIGLSLARAFPRSRVWLTDLSQEALSLARENAASLALQDRVTFLQGDLWEAVRRGVHATLRFDLVIANPPYVAENDTLDDSVIAFEPPLALFSEDDGRKHIKIILKDLYRFLAVPGRAGFELGHYHHQTLTNFLQQNFDTGDYNWELDQHGVPRFLVFDRGAKGHAE